jgi:hypothetical protein
VRTYPHLTGTVTDLLIGDLFTDKVDEVWEPMESMYQSGKQKPGAWSEGIPAEVAQSKSNELHLPVGPRP